MKTKKWLDIEEALGVIYNYREKKQTDHEKIVEVLESGVSKEIVGELRAQNYIRISGGEMQLTPEGEAIGRDVTRRHRLAERLFKDVIEVKGEELDRTACDVEHIISADVTDAICTLLGHPRVCPHGSPIPPGECCKKAESQITSIVVSLDKLPVGEKGVIAYIVTGSHPYLHRLLSLGIVPGTELTLHQKAPSFVIKVGETQIALDIETARQIYVRKV